MSGKARLGATVSLFGIVVVFVVPLGNGVPTSKVRFVCPGTGSSISDETNLKGSIGNGVSNSDLNYVFELEYHNPYR